MRGERPLLSRTIFLYHIFKINLTLVWYGRSVEVRKIGKLLLERHKGGRDRLIEVAARVFSQQRFPPKYIGIVFYAIQSTLTYLEMHSKGRYKICTCSVILGEFWPLRNYKGFNIILQKILDTI